MASSFLRSFSRHGAQPQFGPRMTQTMEDQDKVIASAVQALVLKAASQWKNADKYFGIVARSGDTSVKMRHADQAKAACDFVAAAGRADSARIYAAAKAEAVKMQAEAAKMVAVGQVNAAVARANAAKIRGYAALGAATVLPFGLGFLV